MSEQAQYHTAPYKMPMTRPQYCKTVIVTSNFDGSSQWSIPLENMTEQKSQTIFTVNPIITKMDISNSDMPIGNLKKGHMMTTIEGA